MTRAFPMSLAVALLLLAPAAPATAQELSVETDIPYARRATGELLLDAHLPAGEGPHPAVVWIHGGRWITGDKSQDEVLLTGLASEGFAVFSINYRVVKEARYPGPVEDVQDAVTWVRDNAERFGVDPARIGAVGISSGAQLAGMLGTLDEGPLTSGARVAAVVSFSGPMDMAAAAESSGQLGAAARAFLGCTPPACDEVGAEASPITHVDPTDAPMMLINSAEEIVPASQALSMAEALEGQGVDHELLVIPGTEHGTSVIGGGKGYGPDVETEYIRFLQRHLLGSGEAGPTPGSETPVVGPTATPSPVSTSPASTEGQGGRVLMSLVFLALAAGAVGYWVYNAIAERRRLDY